MTVMFFGSRQCSFDTESGYFRVAKRAQRSWVRCRVDVESVLPVGVDVPIPRGREVRDVDIGDRDALATESRDHFVHVDGVPGDDRIDDEIEAARLVRLLLLVTATHLALVCEEEVVPQCVKGFALVDLRADPPTVVLAVDVAEK